MMRLRRYTRRQVLAEAGRAGAAGAVAITVPPKLLLPGTGPLAGVLNENQAGTLRAAVARIIPSEYSGDWSAADVGADSYIISLLAGVGRIYAGGPFRSAFARFQTLSRVKKIGWSKEIGQLRALYQQGLAELDRLAGGNFAAAPTELQDAVLISLDDSGSDFFAALFNHTMEGVYAHPVYGGNQGYRAWNAFGYAGDVHGVRFPHLGPPRAPWNVFGGYAPQEMAEPGKEST